MKHSNKIEIQLIPANLRRDEMIVRISSALEQLEGASNKIFNEIDSRISEMKERLRDIDSRTEDAKHKISQIKQTENKATRVFSNYKYPKEEISFCDYVPVNNYCFIKDDTNLMRQNKRYIKSSHVPYDDQLLKEKTQFYSIPKRKTKDDWDFNSDGPLGKIPWNRITSVASLLVFNTADNAYSRRSQGK